MPTQFPYGWWVREEGDDLLHRSLTLPKIGKRVETVCTYLAMPIGFVAVMSGEAPATACADCAPIIFQRHDLHRFMPSRLTIDEALQAAAHALKKHGPPTTDPVRGVGVVTEEVGEAMEQALKLTSGNPTERDDQPWAGRVELLRLEWLQIAGYALLQVRNIENGLLEERITDQP